MTREAGRQYSKWWWFLGAMTLIALLNPWRSGEHKTISFPRASPAAVQEIKSSLHIFDKSPQGNGLLFSRTSTGDLWFRDARGRDRCVASEVIRASFSPDGKKFAYGTSGYELFVETIEGKHLAQLARAHDHTWCSNSAAVTFSAIASVDYPELEQTVIYYLDSRQTPARTNGD
jgi:hypothetical protein